MYKYLMKPLFIVVFLGFLPISAFAHVPYFEHKDFSERRPFVVRHTIEQSIAVYAGLENDDTGYSEDVDVYVFDIDETARIYLEVLVPVCEGYEEFVPYTVAMIELDEGPLVTAQLTDVEHDEVEIGMPVEMVTRKLREDGEDGLIVYGYKFRKRLQQQTA